MDREPFGRTSPALVMREYFQPILMEFPELLGKITSGRYYPSRKIPLPEDWGVSVVTDQLTHTLDNPASLRFRLDYGYLSSIKVTDSLDAGSPVCDQVILRLPFRCGTSIDELQDSWLYCRANAFAPTDCFPRSERAIRVGSLRDKSSEKYQTAQLVGRPAAKAADWELFPHQSSPVGFSSFPPMTFIDCVMFFFSRSLSFRSKNLSVCLTSGIFARPPPRLL